MDFSEELGLPSGDELGDFGMEKESLEDLLRRARSFFKNNQLQEALECMDEVIEMDPFLSEAYIQRGVIKSSLNSLEGALDDFNEAVYLNPSPGCFMLRGTAKYNLGKFEDSIEDFTKVIERDPEQPDAYVARGSALKKIGEYEQALDDLNRALELDKKDLHAYVERAEVYKNLGKTEKAEEDRKRIRELYHEENLNMWGF